MSDYLAIAGVSLVLKSFLTNSLSATPEAPASDIYGSNVSVSVLAPDVVPSGPETARLNLFMYYSSIDPALRNAALPAYDANGQRLTNPPLALDLHYLISGYGPGEFDSEILLGWAMQQFHENPVFSRTSIQDLLTFAGSLPSPSAEVQAIVKTTLPFQIESIRITPSALSNDDISRLWMAFSTSYRPTAAYRISVVLIQQTQSVKSNLPVQRRKVLAMPLQGPSIDAITPVAGIPGTVLTLTGSNFIGDSPLDTLVAFGGNTPVPPDSVAPRVIRFTVPSTGLAGVTTIRVATRVTFGSPGDPHVGASSNSMPFMVLPIITTATPISAVAGSNLQLDITPAVGQLQQATVYFGNFSVSIPPRVGGPAISPTLDVLVPAATDLPFPLPATVPLRVELDRAQSTVALDTNPASPTYNQFLPQVAIS